MSEAAEDRQARLALSCATDGGDPAVGDLVHRLGPSRAWRSLLAGAYGEPLRRRAELVDLDQVQARASTLGIRFVVPGEDEWPEPVMDLQHCEPVQSRGGVPYGLWVRGPGHLARLTARSVALVGSRASTPYGESLTTDLAADLAERGVSVVSGGAYGIDAAAHRGALAAGGPTVCVLANGVDIAYPRGNDALIEQIAADHLLVSELPPGATPTRVRFLARNRLIAALSLGTVVVEAAYRSGARNTASWALQCGRQLMAVPGPVSSALSAGPHLMIRNGQATLVTGIGDVLELISALGTNTVVNPQGATRFTDALDASGLAVYEAVPARRRAPVGEIALTAGLAVSACLAELAALELAGRVEGDGRGWRVAAPGAGG